MNLRPRRSHSGPPMAAPIADPNAFALSAAITPTMALSKPNAPCQRLKLVARAMIAPASM